MRFPLVAMLSSAACVLALTAAAPAETTVELKGVHLCCGNCVKTVAATLGKIEGVKGKCDREARTVTITAPDAKTAQKAVNALAAAGFHGKTDSKDVTIKDDSGATKGKVKSLTVTGAHNCCANCCKAIKATVKKVPGVTGDTAKPKADTFEVTGDFDAAALVKALNDAGFHVKVKK
ncbi:MAG TPA: cation transporter [Gemmataceae bacterium]|nr:cation transporter [Gemmataceae bacterium]